MSDDGKKPGGRPRRSKDDGLLSRSLTFRVRPPLYEDVQQAAAKEQRSLSEEIEARLIYSFQQEQLEANRFGDVGTAFLANLIAATVSLEHQRCGKSFLTDPDTCKRIRASMIDAFDTLVYTFQDKPLTAADRRRFDRLEYERVKGGPLDNVEFQDLKTVMGR